MALLSRRAVLALGASAVALAAINVYAAPGIEDIKAIVVQVANKYGISPAAFLKMCQIESNFNPKAFHPKSRAAGLFQFIPSTARAYNLADPFDPLANAEAAARLWNDNVKAFQRKMKRPPTAGECYLAHQQGLGGAIALISNSHRPAVEIVGRKAVVLNGGHLSMTAGEFASIWTDRFANI